MSQKTELRALLEHAAGPRLDGPNAWWSTYELLGAVPCIVHSRMAELRADLEAEGTHKLEHETRGPGSKGSWWRIVPLEAGACADPSRGAGAPASRLSNLGLSSGSPDTPQPLDGPLVLEGQETLL